MADSEVKQAVRVEDTIEAVKEIKPQKTPRKKIIKLVLGGCIWLLSIVVAIILGIIGYAEVDRWLSSQEWFRRLKGGEPVIEQPRREENKKPIVYDQGEPIEISDKIVQVVEKVGPAVVSVAKVFVKRDTSSTIGTGFIIDSQNGYLLTNQHVVSDVKAKYAIITNEGKKYSVDEIFRDDLNDIAVLKVDFGEDKPKQVELGDSDSLKIGQTVIAIGNPLGEYPGTVTHGIVSGLHRTVEAGDVFGNTKTYDDVIQTDAAINFGNSGGPLLDSAGLVVGINFGINRSNEAEGISFAIPINKVKERLAVFNKYGYFPKPYLGVSYEMVSEIESLMYNIPSGALVKDVIAGSPADKAGIQEGDIIVEVDGKSLDETLSSIIQSHEIGDKIKVKVWRSIDDKEETFEVTVTLEDGGKLQ